MDLSTSKEAPKSTKELARIPWRVAMRDGQRSWFWLGKLDGKRARQLSFAVHPASLNLRRVAEILSSGSYRCVPAA